MNKKILTAILAAAVLGNMCGCTEKTTSPSENGTDINVQSETKVQEATVPISPETLQYQNGNVIGPDFSYYADPSLWKFTNSSTDTCDLRMLADKDFTTCGISIFSSDEKNDGQSAQLKVLSVVNRDEMISQGTLVTSSLTFYYYEWTIDNETNARTYLADYGNDKYICLYAESTNFGITDVKLADILSTLKLEKTEQ